MSLDNSLSRRQFLSRMAVVSAGLALAACAPQAEPTPEAASTEAQPAEAKPAAEQPAAPQPAASPVEVRYLSWWGAFNTIVLPEALKEYKDLRPNVTITVEEVPQAEFAQKAQTTLVAGTAADILYHENYMSKYYSENLILELDDRFDAAGIDFDTDFYEGLGLCRWAGKLYGFPHMWETCLYMYNKTAVKESWGKDLWEAFPDGMWDFNDFVEVAKATTKKTSDGKTEFWGLYMNHRNYYYGPEVLGWSQGDSIFDVQNMKYNFTSPIISEVHHWLLNAVRNEGFLMSQEDYSEVTQAAGLANAWEAGKVALYLRMSTDIGRGLQTIGDKFDGTDKFDWDVFYLPNYGDKLGVTRAGGHPHNIAKSTKVADDAWELCRWLGMEGQKYIATSKVSVPVWRKDPNLRSLFETGKPPHDKVILGVLEDRGGYGDHLRFHNEGEVRDMYTKEFDLLYNMPYAEADAQLDEVCARLEQQMNDAVDYGPELPFPDLQFPFKPYV